MNQGSATETGGLRGLQSRASFRGRLAVSPGASSRESQASSRLLAQIATAVIIPFCTVIVAATPAAAAETGWSGATSQTGCHLNMADNLTNSYYKYNLETYESSAVTWVTNYIESATNVDEQSQSSSNADTDVIYNDGPYSDPKKAPGPPCSDNSSWYPTGGGVGVTACWSGTSWGGCQQHRVYFDTAWVNDNPDDSHIRSLVLHESGHALGLEHPVDGFGNAVNVDGEVMSPRAGTITSLSSRDKSLINNFSRSSQ